MNRTIKVNNKPIEDNITRYSGLVTTSPFSINGLMFSFSAIHTKENSIHPVQTKIPPNNPSMVANDAL